MPVEDCVEILFQGIRDKQLYVISHERTIDAFKRRTDNIVNRRNPEIAYAWRS